MSSLLPGFLRDAQRRAAKLGRHARDTYLKALGRLAKSYFGHSTRGRRCLPPQAVPPPNRLPGSTFTPGPMVEDTATRWM